MELIGFELDNYATFARRFIPLRRGLNVLVGKNNSGKTALLRGASLLNQLSQKGPAMPEVAGYCGQTSRYVRCQTYFEIESTDPNLFVDCTDEKWREFVTQRHPLLRQEAVVFAGGGPFGYGACDMLVGAEQVAFFIWQGNRLHQIARYLQGGESDLGALVYGNQVNAPDGRIYHQGLPPPFETGFRSVNLTRMVDAHRITRPNVPLSTVDDLGPNAELLPAFLQTLQVNEPPKFAAIKDFLTTVFPEFQNVYTESRGGHASITFGVRDSNQRTPLTHCGTGVEQILALAAFVIASPPGSVILLDEPHSYLHPSAERQLTTFLHQH